jgi:hypothetical protein
MIVKQPRQSDRIVCVAGEAEFKNINLTISYMNTPSRGDTRVIARGFPAICLQHRRALALPGAVTMRLHGAFLVLG